MKTNTSIHSLASPNTKSGKIRFIHRADNTEHVFYTCVNRMSGDRLSGFDNSPPTVNDSMKYIKSVFRDIRKKADVIEVTGDF